MNVEYVLRMLHSLKSKFWGSVRLSVVIALWAPGGQTLNGRVKGDAKVHIYIISWLWLTFKPELSVGLTAVLKSGPPAVRVALTSPAKPNSLLVVWRVSVLT